MLDTFENYLSQLHMPVVRTTDIIEIFVIAFLLYHILVWLKSTRVWSLVRGLLIILAIVILAAVFNMTTILWMVQNFTSIAIIAIVVVLQPELRAALEGLGENAYIRNLFRIDISRGSRFSDRTVDEIVRACAEMGKCRTGALIVIENNMTLTSFKRTGIEVDGLVSSQLLINLFEKNTPMHDGAVIISGDRVSAATCYLPLSDASIDKRLGTRHRAGLGISEITDSLTVIVSEETGKVSAAYQGELIEDLDAGQLKEMIALLQHKDQSQNRKNIFRNSPFRRVENALKDSEKKKNSSGEGGASVENEEPSA